ncbi:MAG TPA: hypothetical protein VJA40_02335 [archaeon]|nr:hypothetical protein [archaeon]
MDKNKKGKKGSKLAILTALNAFFFLGVLAVSAFTLYSSGPELKKVFFASDPRDDPSNVLNLQAATATQGHPLSEIKIATTDCFSVIYECIGDCDGDESSPNQLCAHYGSQYKAIATSCAKPDSSNGEGASGSKKLSLDTTLGDYCKTISDQADIIVNCCAFG